MKAASLSACGTLLLLSTLSSPVAALASWSPWIGGRSLRQEPSVGAFGRINVGALDRILDRIPVMATTDNGGIPSIDAIVQDSIITSDLFLTAPEGAEDAAIVQDNGLVPNIEPEVSLGETGEDIDVPPFSPSALSAVTIDNDNLLGAPLAWRVADQRWLYDDLPQPSNGGDGGDGGRAPEPPRQPGDDNDGSRDDSDGRQGDQAPPRSQGFATDPDADFSLINLSGTSARSLPPPFPPNAG